jgi:hypothetical protein
MSVAKVIELWGGVTRQQRLTGAVYWPLLEQASLYIISRQPKSTSGVHTWDGEYVNFTVEFDGRSHEFRTNLNDTFRRKVGGLSQEFESRNDGLWVHFADGPSGRDDRIFTSHHDVAVYWTNGWEPLTHHEVLYVGKGTHPNAYHRLQRHPTLQRIYGDHVATNFDIFITYIELSNVSSTAILGDENSVGFVEQSQFSKFPLRSQDVVRDHAIDIAEAALITWFQPRSYNKTQLRFPSGTRKLASRLRLDGFTKLFVTLNLEDSGIRLWSSQRPEAHRFIAAELDVVPINKRDTAALRAARADTESFFWSCVEATRREIEKTRTSFALYFPDSQV